MAWQKESSATYTGASGQMAVIAELLHRKCNVAVPHVDVGTDLFAFRDDGEEVARIQVKTARATFYTRGQGYHAKFGVPIAQLVQASGPVLFYTFAVRWGMGWGSLLVIERVKLKELRDLGLGSDNPKSGQLELHLQFHLNDQKKAIKGPEGRQNLRVLCGKFDLSEWVNAWEILPPLALSRPSPR